MLYNQPLDQPSNPNAPYVDGNPAAGIQGSIVPAASIEFDQREVVEVITRANVRGYSDFSGTACAIPNNADLTQLRKAIEGFITSWQYLITTEVTFTVHGPGADFADLNAAFAYLGKYKITPTGHVILQLAGASAPTNIAAQYVYTTTILIDHPNNDRISIFGAPMLAPVPRTDVGYAWNGPSPTQRAADAATNLAMLRSKFATELHFVGGQLTTTYWPNAAVIISGLVPMHLDGILFTGDNSPAVAAGLLFNCAGYMNNLPSSINGPSPFRYDGLAVCMFPGGNGINFDVGSCIAVEGESNDMNYVTPFISIGNNNGIAITNGGFITCSGNALCFNNAAGGFSLWPRSGTQWDGGLFCNANGAMGVQCYLSSTGYLAAPILANAYSIGPSHYWRNGGWGIWLDMSNVGACCDCGQGANANVGGTIIAMAGSQCDVWNPSAGGSPYVGACSPPFGTIGNNNAMIASGW